jgi:hypothetical protein
MVIYFDAIQVLAAHIRNHNQDLGSIAPRQQNATLERVAESYPVLSRHPAR